MSLLRFPATLAAITGTAVLITIAAPAARADVKLVTTMTMTSTGQQPGMMGGGGGNQKFTTTTYIKGGKTRTETGSTSITISDSATGTVYTLNPSAKTYTTTNINATLDQAQGMMAMMDFKATGDVKPGGKTRTILGKPAKNYLISSNITMGFKAGARPGGASASAPPVKTGVPLMTINIKGEQWATEAVKLPANSGLSNVRMMQSGLNRIPGLKSFAATMSKIKGLPLEGVSTQQMVMNMGAAMGGAGGAGGAPAKPMVMTMKTQPVSLSEAPLPDSLFAIPAGYRKVAAPVRRPGMGGGMGARPPMSAN